MPVSWRDVLQLNPSYVPYRAGGLGRYRTQHVPPPKPSFGGGFQGGGERGEMDDRLRQALEKVRGTDGGADPLGAIFGASRNALKAALDIVDTPRAAVISTLGELDRMTAGDDFSFSDIVEGTMENRSAAEAFNTSDPSSLVADILLDPLNYVAPAATIGDAQSVARRLTTEGVEQLGREGAQQAAARVLKEGTASALKDSELAAIGEKGGVYLNTPGTGMVGRSLGIDRVLDRYGLSHQFQIASRQSAVGRAGQAASRVLHKPVAAALGSKPAQALVRRGMSGDYAQFRLDMRSGDPERATRGLWGLQSTAEGRGAGRGFKANFAPEATEILDEMRARGVSGQDMFYAVGGSKGRAPEDLVERAKTLFGDMLVDANSRADLDGVGRAFLADRGDDYVTRLRSSVADEVAEIPDASIVNRRKYGWDVERGDTDVFLGQKLTNPKSNGGVSVEQQMKDAARNAGWEEADVEALFKDDFFEVLPSYINMLGDQVGREYTAGRLRQVGVAEDLFGTRPVEGTREAADARATVEGAMGQAEADVAGAERTIADSESGIAAALRADEAAQAERLRLVQEEADAVAEWGTRLSDVANRMDERVQEFMSGRALEGEQAAENVRLAKAARDADEAELDALLGRLDDAKAGRDKLAEKAANMEGDPREVLGQIEDLDSTILAMEVEAVEAMGDVADFQRRAHEVSSRLVELKNELRIKELDLYSLVPEGEVGDIQGYVRSRYQDPQQIERGLRKAGADPEEVRDEAFVQFELTGDDELEPSELWRQAKAVSHFVEREADEAAMAAEITALEQRVTSLRRNIAQGEALLDRQETLLRRVENVRDDRLAKSSGAERAKVVLEQQLHDLVNESVQDVHGQLDDAEREVADVLVNVDAQRAKASESAEKLTEAEAELDRLTPTPEAKKLLDLEEGNPSATLRFEMIERGVRLGWLKPKLQAALHEVFGFSGTERIVGYGKEGASLEDAVRLEVRGRMPEPMSPYPGVSPGGGDDYTRDVFQGDEAFDDPSVLRFLEGRGSGGQQTGLKRIPGEIRGSRSSGRSVRQGEPARLGPEASRAERKVDPRGVQIPGSFKGNPWSAGFDEGKAYRQNRQQDFNWRANLPEDHPGRLKGDMGDSQRLNPDRRGDVNYVSGEDPVWPYGKMAEDFDPAEWSDPLFADSEPGAPLPTEDELVEQTLDALEQELGEEAVARAERGFRHHLKSRVPSDPKRMQAAKDASMAVRLRREAQRKYAEAEQLRATPAPDGPSDETLAQIASLEAQAADAEAAILGAQQRIKGYKRRLDSPVTTPDGVFKVFDRLRDAEYQERTVSMLRDGFRKFGTSTQAPEEMVEVMVAAQKMSVPNWIETALKPFDAVQNLWKAYVLANPGTQMRNLMGGLINNYLGDVDPKMYGHYMAATAAESRGTWDAWARKNPELAQAWVEAERLGVRTGGQNMVEVPSRLAAGSNKRPWSTDFAPLRGARQGAHIKGQLVAPGGQQIENVLRTTMFMNEFVRNGGNASEAFAKMTKFHFDYDDLSLLERNVARRAMPFYTWTRRNLPLQLEMLAKRPQKINRYFVIKRDVEAMSEEEGVVPDYYADAFAMRLPFDLGEGQAYLLPDMMGASQLGEFTDPGMTLGMVSPFVKSPLEWATGRQVYKGLPLTGEQRPAPLVMQAVPGLMPALGALGFADRGEGGWTMRDKDMYLVDQMMPWMAKARRMVPNDERYEDRRWASILSTFLGVGLRSNTKHEQELELWDRYHEIKAKIDRLEQTGTVEPENSTSVMDALEAGDLIGDPEEYEAA